MIVPWGGLSWLGWRNSKQMRAVFPGGEGRLFAAILMATMPWFLGPPLGKLTFEAVEATGLTGWTQVAAGAAIGAVLGGVALALIWHSRGLVAQYMRLREAQASGADLRQAAIDAVNEAR